MPNCSNDHVRDRDAPRHGDAEIGYGMDLGGRLAWTDGTLLAHVVDGRLLEARH
jgi:hypothetical protein